MPKVYAIDGIVPVVHPTAFVHASAVLIGDAIVGERAYIGPGVSLRGDFGRIVVEAGANIQDNCILHGFAGKDTVVGADCTIGHGAILHGCVVRRGALVGMNCVVNDNAEVGEDAIVAALAFVKAEERIPARSVAAGIPAKVRRAVTDGELAWKHANLLVYQDLTLRSMQTMQLVEARTEVEKDRKRFHFPTSIPLSELKKQHG